MSEGGPISRAKLPCGPQNIFRPSSFRTGRQLCTCCQTSNRQNQEKLNFHPGIIDHSILALNIEHLANACMYLHVRFHVLYLVKFG